MQSEHIPVLAKTLLEWVNLPQDAVMVDATIGHGGHSFLFARKLGLSGTIVGFDVDEKSIQTARSKLSNLSCKVILIRENFANVVKAVRSEGIEKVDFMLADLGVCSAQLEDTEKGLSFMKNMPLDMRLDKRLKTTAADIVNSSDEKSLADLIYNFGQDRASRRIARFIVTSRQNREIKTTLQLAEIVCKALGQPATGRKSKIHPATRTFQALRIAVNNEMENLEKFLTAGPELLKKNGYIAVISFHSLEDKLVKESFRKNQLNGTYRIVTKKPLEATEQEIDANPRARSAKLRIAQRQ